MLNSDVIELRWIYAVVRRWWWLIIGLMIDAAIVAYIITSFMPPVYESSALLLVNSSKNSNESQYSDLMAGTQLALTYSKMLTDRPVLEKVISDLGLKLSASALAKRITAEPVSSSQIIKLTVKDSNAKQAALIANTLAQAFTMRVQELSIARYAGSINNAKVRIDDLQAQMTDLRAQVDTIRSQKVTKDVAQANKQTLLTTLQSDYQSLQNSYRDLQLTMAQVSGNVYIVDPVQDPQSNPGDTNFARAVVSVGQAQSTGSSENSHLPLTYAQVLIQPPLLQKVINELGLWETTDQLSKMVKYELVTGTQLIRIEVVDSDQAKAQLIAQSLVNEFVAQVKTMLVEPYSDQLQSMKKQQDDMAGSINNAQTEIGILTAEIAQMAADLDRLESDLLAVRSDYRDALQNYQQLQQTAAESSDAVTVTQPAEAPNLPSRNQMLYVVLAAALGLVAGGGIAFFVDYHHGKVQTDKDVNTALNMSVLSTIGRLAREDTELVMNSAPTSIVAEDFRILSNKVRLLRDKASITTILMTSPVPTEGKSFVVSNLAISLSRMGLRVVLVDADLHLPRLHTIFGITQEKGLSNTLSNGTINGTIQSTSIEGLKVLTSGELPANPAELLGSSNLEDLLKELKGKTDFVLIDCPPVFAASDASILASKVDGVLLVLRAGYTESKSAREAVEVLRQAKANLVGIVLNSVTMRNRKWGYYRYSK